MQLMHDAPLQLYCAAILFAPLSSQVRKRYLSEIPRAFCNLSRIEESNNFPAQVIKTHYGHIDSLIFSPNGRYLLLGVEGEESVMMKLTTGTSLQHIDGSIYNGYCHAAFSPDSQRIAFASTDNHLKVWDIATSRITVDFGPSKQCILQLAFTPGGDVLTSVEADGVLNIYDMYSETLSGTFNNVEYGSDSLKISADGKYIAWKLCDTKPTVRLRNMETTEMTDLKCECDSPDEFVEISFSKTANELYLCTLSRAAIYKYELGSRLRPQLFNSHEPRPGYRLRLSSGCKYALYVESVMVHNAPSKIFVSRMGVGDLFINGERNSTWATFSSNGEYLILGSNDMRIKIVHLDTQRMIGSVEHQVSVKTVEISPNSKLLAIGGADGSVRFWELEKLADASDDAKRSLRWDIGWCSLNCLKLGLQILSDANSVAIPCRTGAVEIRDLCSGAFVQEIGGHSGIVKDLSTISNGRLLALLFTDGCLQVFETCSLDLVAQFHGYRFTSDMIISPDTNYLVMFRSPSSKFDVISVKRLEVLYSLPCSKYSGVVFSQDSTFYVTQSSDAEYTCHRTDNGNLLSIRTKFRSYAGMKLALSSNDYMADTTDDSSLLLLQFSSSEHSILEHSSWRHLALAFSPNNQLLFSLSYDGYLKVWNVATRKLIKLVFMGCKPEPEAKLSFSDDGQLLLGSWGSWPIQALYSDVKDALPLDARTKAATFADGKWLMRGQSRLLWLSPDNRARFLAVHENTVVIRHVNGDLSMMRIDTDQADSWEPIS